MSPYNAGGLVGSVIGMVLLGHLPYWLLSRFLKDHRLWIAVGVSPVLMYGIAVAGYWGDPGSFRSATVGYLLGALLFVIIRVKRSTVPMLKPTGLALGGIGTAYLAVGIELALAGSRSARTLGCLDSFLRDLSSVQMDHAEASAYCGCLSDGMSRPSCKSISLLWSNEATEKCSGEFQAELASSDEAKWRLQELKDRCIATHLSKVAPQITAVFVKAALPQFAAPILATDDFRALKLTDGKKREYVDCFLHATAAKCPTQTLSGVQHCLVDAVTKEGDKKLWAGCAAETGIVAGGAQQK